MLKYVIKENDYPIGFAIGKNKAVERIKHYLEWEGITEAKWKNKAGKIIVETQESIFTIEKYIY